MLRSGHANNKERSKLVKRLYCTLSPQGTWYNTAILIGSALRLVYQLTFVNVVVMPAPRFSTLMTEIGGEERGRKGGFLAWTKYL